MRQLLLRAALAALLVAGLGLTERPSDDEFGRSKGILPVGANEASQEPVVRSADPSEITLVPGGASVVVTLRGSGLDRLDGGYVAAGGQRLTGIDVRLDRQTSRDSRQLTIVAGGRVRPVGGLELVVTVGRSATSTPAQLTVRLPIIEGLTIQPAALPAGESAIGEVRLDLPAPAAGLQIALSSSDPSVLGAPGSVTVPGGETTASFPVSAAVGSQSGQVTLNATLGRDTRSTAVGVEASVEPVVMTPAAGEQLYSGRSHVITWFNFEGPEVKIDLYRGNLSQGTVVAFTPNDGSFEWTVPGLMAASNYHLVVRDLSDTSRIASSADFTIGPAPVTIEVLSPAAGDVWHLGATYTISWTGVDGPDVQIDLYRGNVAGTLAPSTPNDGAYQWTPTSPWALASDYRVIVRDLSTMAFKSSDQFSIEPPAAAVTRPVEGDVVAAGSPITVEWSAFPSTSAVRIEICRPDQICSTVVTTAASAGSHEWVANVTPGAGYFFRATSTGESSISAESGRFEIAGQ